MASLLPNKMGSLDSIASMSNDMKENVLATTEKIIKSGSDNDITADIGANQPYFM